ncbi:MAG: response regulator [Bryobacterales bacterium]|nr:response regulator [Acidobacteriota bacterium]MCB9385634.1 response regulator [Bryobacterales bacterium]
MSAPQRILVVDDESDIVRTLQFRLQAAGFEVVTATNGTEALARISEQPVDLILSDFMMPEMNGIELTRTIKANPRFSDTKVMLFSANSDPEFRQRAKELGAIDYLPKTLGAVGLLDKIRAQIEGEHRHSGAAVAVAASRMREMASLARSLSDMLHLARSSGPLSEPALFALNSAQRVADDMTKIAEGEEAQ